jgi:cystathionine gamma-synthase
MSERRLSPETIAAQALGDIDPLSGCLAPMINPSTNYEQQPDGSYRQDRVYTRADNPTYEYAERLLAALEGAGCVCALFSSGMAAVTATFQSLPPGDHVLVPRVLYWACGSGWPSSRSAGALTWSSSTRPTCTPLSPRSGPVARGFSGSKRRRTPPGRSRISPASARSPTLPGFGWPSMHGGDPCADPPHGLRCRSRCPLVHEDLNGHSDVLAGAVLTARPDPFWERIRSWRRNSGALLGPFEAWLLQRGMRTLFLRVRRASESALTIAGHFEGHPALAAVLYPGLPAHPGHEIASSQMSGGFGGMLSIRLAGERSTPWPCWPPSRCSSGPLRSVGREPHRAPAQHGGTLVPCARRSAAAINRLEDPEDLVADLEATLEAASDRVASVAVSGTATLGG